MNAINISGTVFAARIFYASHRHLLIRQSSGGTDTARADTHSLLTFAHISSIVPDVNEKFVDDDKAIFNLSR